MITESAEPCMFGFPKNHPGWDHCGACRVDQTENLGDASTPSYLKTREKLKSNCENETVDHRKLLSKVRQTTSSELVAPQMMVDHHGTACQDSAWRPSFSYGACPKSQVEV